MKHGSFDAYDTSRMYFDPKSPGFIKNMNKFPEFKLKSLGDNREKYLVYIAMMYDKNSELSKNNEYTYWQKKKIAAEMAGFKLIDGRFEVEVEDALFSKNEDFVKAMIRYLRFQHMPKFTQLKYYEMLNDQLAMNAMMNQDNDAMKKVTELTKEIAVLTDDIFGGEESYRAIEKLYADVDEIDISGIRAEGVAKKLEEGGKLEEFSPYPNYDSTGDIKFEGDEIPIG